MLSFFKIGTIALYEIKTLLRSWFFRIFSLLAIGIIILLNIFMFVSNRTASWSLRAVPSSIPYMNLLLLNVVQAIIGIFLASDFLKYDRKLDSTEVIYMRSMTNADYVFGKTFGIFIVLMLLNILILCVSFVFNFFFTDVPVIYFSYLYYPLFISIPTLIFVFGLSFFSMSLMSSQALTFIILLGYITSTIFFLGNKFHYLFDYMAYNVPMMYSDFVGFGNIDTILIHRGIYLLLGFGFIFATVLLLKRLPQSKLMNRVSIIMVILCTGGAFMLGHLYLSRIYQGRELRSQMAAFNNRYAKEPRISISDCSLDLTHQGEEIEVSADIVVHNTTDSIIDTYIFSLNPGLEIQNISSGGKQLDFNRNQHILTVKPSNKLNPGVTDSLSIHYRGVINEEACYIDMDETEREKSYTMFLYKIDKRYAFITPEYVLLTPENLWYPIAGIPFGSVYPEALEKDFVTFELRVKTQGDLTAISQGNVEQTGRGEFFFQPDVPMPQISLAIGDYEKRTMTADDMEYNLFIKKGHDYFSEYFTEIGEKLPELVSELKQDFERKMKLTYPYKRFTLIETPVQFFCYERFWTVSVETVQPEQVLLPEKGIFLFNSDFKRMKYWQGHDRGRGNITRTPEEIESDQVRRFVQSTFTGEFSSRRFASFRRSITSSSGISVRRILIGGFSPSFVPSYEIFPNYYSYVYNFNSEKHPIFNLSLEHFLLSNLENGFPGRMRFILGLSNEEIANNALAKQNLSELLVNPEYKDIMYDILKIKVDYLFSLIKAELGENEFDQFLHDYLENNRFKNLDVIDFLDALWIEFGFELEYYFDEWYNGKVLPAYIFSDLKCTEVLDNETTRYQVLFKVYNAEPADGVISLSIISGGGGMGRGGGGMGRGGGPPEPELEYYTIVKGNQTKEIGLLLDEQPLVISFNTFISQNIPSAFDQRPENPELDENAEIFEGERILDYPLTISEPGEIIVDNEDENFEILTHQEASFIKKYINKNRINDEEEYTGMNFWHPPNRWRATVMPEFHGKFKHSAYYIKTGGGDQKVQWKAEIPDSGQYDIYYNCIEAPNFGRGHGRDRRDGGIRDFHFTIYHDDGIEEMILDLNESDTGWTYLGTYYLSQGFANIELNNKSKGTVVYADAVKWIKKK